MAKVSVASKLRELKEKWKAATPRTGGGLPDGDYEGVIKSAVIKICSDGELQAVWELEVTAPSEFEKRKQNKFSYLGGETSLDWFKGDLALLGVEPPDDIDDMPNAVGQTEGLPVAFRVKAKQENTNVYFLGLLEGEEVVQLNGKDEEAEQNNEELTKDNVAAMGQADDEEGLQAIIDEYELDINQDDYETYPEVASTIIVELQL